jgi:hypothetical protein
MDTMDVAERRVTASGAQVMTTTDPGQASQAAGDNAAAAEQLATDLERQSARLEQALRAAGALPDDSTLNAAAEALARQGLAAAARGKWYCTPGLYCVYVRW